MQTTHQAQLHTKGNYTLKASTHQTQTTQWQFYTKSTYNILTITSID